MKTPFGIKMKVIFYFFTVLFRMPLDDFITIFLFLLFLSVTTATLESIFESCKSELKVKSAIFLY